MFGVKHCLMQTVHANWHLVKFVLFAPLSNVLQKTNLVLKCD